MENNSGVYCSKLDGGLDQDCGSKNENGQILSTLLEVELIGFDDGLEGMIEKGSNTILRIMALLTADTEQMGKTERFMSLKAGLGIINS